MIENRIDHRTLVKDFLVVSAIGLSLFVTVGSGPVHADDPSSGGDHGASKPKINFRVGPVTKTPDSKGKNGDGKSKDNGGQNTHH